MIQTAIGLSAEHFEQQLQEARQVIDGDIEWSTSGDFPDRVNRRLQVAQEFAQHQVRKVAPHTMANAIRLMNQANNATSRATRAMWLIKSANQFAEAVEPVSACKSGCSHCCHIPVALTRIEAERISSATGHKMVSNPSRLPVEASYKNPCVFLHEHKCSIYEHRPIACRTYFNLDADNLLCQLVPGASIPVPLPDTRAFAAMNFKIGGHTEIADIRHWFAQQEPHAQAEKIHP